MLLVVGIVLYHFVEQNPRNDLSLLEHHLADHINDPEVLIGQMDGDAGLDFFESSRFVLDEKHRERDDIGDVKLEPLGVDLLEDFHVMEAEILLMSG